MRFVFVEQRVAFGLADLLDDDLLGGLGADAADGFVAVERRRRCACRVIVPSARSMWTTISSSSP